MKISINATLILFLFYHYSIFAQKIDPNNLIINNVRIISNTSDTTYVEASIFIKDNTVKLVSRERLNLKDTYMLDARGGYLLGHLVINESPRFVILKQDPRKNFRVLISFESNTIFAIEDGIIHRNRLNKDYGTTNDKTPSETIKWLAYQPPPVSLPLSYSNSKKWNYLDTKYFSTLFFSALGLDRLYWLSQNNSSKDQIGNLNSNAGGTVRGFRLGLLGKIKTFKTPWSYTFFIASNAYDKNFESGNLNNFILFDYRLDIPLYDKYTLSIGKQKEPISFGRIPSSLFVPMQERVSDAFLNSRNIGIQLSGNVLGNKMSWIIGAYNSWFENSGNFSENETAFISRLTGVVYDKSQYSTLVHIGLGNRFGLGGQDINYRIKPEFQKSISFLETGLIKRDFVNLLAPEISFLRGPFWFFSEYNWNYVNATSDYNYSFKSFQITGSWVLTGEHRSYNYRNGTVNPIEISNMVTHGGWGAVEFALRYSNYNLNSNDIKAGNMNIYSAGLNWWLTSQMMLSLNYRYIRTNSANQLGIANGLNTRILLILD